jgi:hypothetical protein
MAASRVGRAASTTTAAVPFPTIDAHRHRGSNSGRHATLTKRCRSSFRPSVRPHVAFTRSRFPHDSSRYRSKPPPSWHGCGTCILHARVPVLALDLLEIGGRPPGVPVRGSLTHGRFNEGGRPLPDGRSHQREEIGHTLPIPPSSGRVPTRARSASAFRLGTGPFTSAPTRT